MTEYVPKPHEPCPFCAFEDATLDGGGDYGFAVSCDDCGAEGPTALYGLHEDARAEAIRLWNDRGERSEAARLRRRQNATVLKVHIIYVNLRGSAQDEPRVDSVYADKARANEVAASWDAEIKTARAKYKKQGHYDPGCYPGDACEFYVGSEEVDESVVGEPIPERTNHTT